jgi:hypothetical protein
MSEAIVLERRNFGRRRSCIHATCIVAGRPQSPCLVRNWSRSGALLELNEIVDPPYSIRLRLESGEADLPCEVKHARGYYIGVRFMVPDAYMRLNEAFDDFARGSRRRRHIRIFEPVQAMKPVSSRDLRRRVLGIAVQEQ